AAEGGDLVHHSAVVQHPDRPELDPDRDRSPEETPDLLRCCRRGQIPVQMWVAEERVSDGTANAPGLEAGVLEPLRYVEHRAARTQLPHDTASLLSHSIRLQQRMNIDHIVSASSATAEFKRAVRAFAATGQAERLVVLPRAPRIKVLRLLAQ